MSYSHYLTKTTVTENNKQIFAHSIRFNAHTKFNIFLKLILAKDSVGDSTIFFFLLLLPHPKLKNLYLSKMLDSIFIGIVNENIAIYFYRIFHVLIQTTMHHTRK